MALQPLFYELLFPEFFKKTCSILAQFPSSFFFILFIIVQVVHPHISTNTATAGKKSRIVLISLSVDEILLPRYVNWSTNVRGLPLNTGVVPFV